MPRTRALLMGFVCYGDITTLLMHQPLTTPPAKAWMHQQPGALGRLYNPMAMVPVWSDGRYVPVPSLAELLRPKVAKLNGATRHVRLLVEPGQSPTCRWCSEPFEPVGAVGGFGFCSSACLDLRKLSRHKMTRGELSMFREFQRLVNE